MFPQLKEAYLIEKLSNPQLKFGEFFFLSYISIVDGMFSNLFIFMTRFSQFVQPVSSIVYLNVQMNPQLGSTEPLGRVCVEADDVFTRNGGGEGEPALAAVNLQQILALNCVGGFISQN